MSNITRTRISNYVRLEELHEEIQSKLKGLVKLGALPRKYAEELYSDINEYSRRSYLHCEDALWIAIEASADTGNPVFECYQPGMSLINEETLY